MHFHLPKPLHGWRVFVGEVGIIVIGVLIALGTQQVVEELQWREEVRLTEEALTNEIALSLVSAAERKMVDQCLRDRLAHLITKIRSEDMRWTADPMQLGNTKFARIVVAPAAYRAPARDWDISAWDSAKSSGVLSHMPRKRVAAYSAFYAALDGQRQSQVVEGETFPELLYLSFDTALDAQARRQAMSTLGRLDWLNGLAVNTADDLIDAARALHLDFSRTNVTRDVAEAERGLDQTCGNPGR